MAIIYLGKIKLTNRGDWNSQSTYEADDFVSHGNHSFICVLPHTNEEPYDEATGTLKSTYWNFLAKGASQADWAATTGDSQILNRPNTFEPHLRVKAFPRYEANYHSYRQGLVLMEDGTVRAWGSDSNAAHGAGIHYNVARHLPVTTGLNGKAVKLFQTRDAAYAIMTDGGVKAWGYNGYGAFGRGNTTLMAFPVDVPIPAGRSCISIATCPEHSHMNSYTLYLLDDGTVRASGYNGYGQCGDNTTTHRYSLVTVSGLSNITEVYNSGGNYGSSYALKGNGTAWAWGWNAYGELGVGNTTHRYTPTQVTLPAGCVKIQPTGHGSYGNCFFLLDDGRLFATGYNVQGTLGAGDASNRHSPVDVTPAGGLAVTDVKSTTGSNGSTIILLSDGTIRTTGYNGHGILATGGTAQRNSWYNPGMTNVLQVFAAQLQDTHGHFAVLVDIGNGDGSGKVYAVGYNGSSNLGIGHNVTNSTWNGLRDSRVFQPCFAPENIVEMRSIGHSSECSLMLRDNQGNVLTTGYSGSGQLGWETNDENASVFNRVQI